MNKHSLKKFVPTVYLFVLCIALVLIRSTKLNLCSDYLWHYKIGEYMVQNKSFFWTDTFSWLSAEGLTTQFTYSWLSDIIIYLMSSRLATEVNPLLGVWIYERLLFIITLLIILFSTRKYFVRIKKFNILVCLLIIAPTYKLLMFSPRPQMISNVLFAIILYLFQEWNDGRTKSIYFLPVITLIWANTHGATVSLPILFCISYLVCTRIELSRGLVCSHRKSIGETKALAITTAISFVTSLINPYTYRVFTYFLTYNNSIVKTFITEMQPSTIKSNSGVIIAIVLAVGFIFSKKKYSLYQMIPVIATFILTLLHIRGCYYFAIAVSFFIPHLLKANNEDFVKSQSGKLYKAFCAFVLVSLTVFAGISTYKNLTVAVPYMMNDPAYIDTAAIEYVKENGYKRLYNSYNTGGHLMYHDVPVFVDSRAELYSEEVLSDMAALCSWRVSNNEMENIISKYNFDGLYVENSSLLYKYLINSDYYNLMYQGNTCSVFEHKIA